MPLILHKVVPLLMYPLNVSIVLVVAAVVFRRKVLAIAAVVLLAVCSTPVKWVIGGLEHSTPIVSVADCSQADAIMILGGMAGPSYRAGDIEWDTAVDRFEYGVALYKMGKAPRVILSAGQLPWKTEREPESVLIASAAASHGVPRDTILFTRPVTNTANEAQAAKELSDQYSLRQIILVTSAFHMPRAKRLFERAGVRIVPFPVDFQFPAEPLEFQDFLPQASALAITEIAVRERLGLLYYAWKH